MIKRPFMISPNVGEHKVPNQLASCHNRPPHSPQPAHRRSTGGSWQSPSMYRPSARRTCPNRLNRGQAVVVTVVLGQRGDGSWQR
jgi:hypothetical protein